MSGARRESLSLQTGASRQMLDVTERVVRQLNLWGAEAGLLSLWVPHTTAAITVNEHADPDVARDLVGIWNRHFVHEEAYLHREGNTSAHWLSSLVGVSLVLPVCNGTLPLGVWQGLFFCEFDGPRQRCLELFFFPTTSTGPLDASGQ